MKQYYEELTTRLQSMEESEASGRDYPEDRMYM